MSRRITRPTVTAVTTAAPCPCGLPAPYGDCCGRLHRGESAAPTAELLMRSRFSAFAVRDESYLVRTWHPATRPQDTGIDPGLQWVRLEIHSVFEGGPFHTHGTVDFSAHFIDRGYPEVLHEHSRFVRHEGAWVYFDALPQL